jgi:hypothetical protein
VPEPVEVYWMLKLFWEALKSEAQAWMKGNGKEAPPPLMVFAAWAGAARATVDAATAAPASIARVRRTVFSLIVGISGDCNVGTVRVVRGGLG